jgi:curved DNA-binding protein CbpA
MSRRNNGACDNKFYNLLEIEPTADESAIKKAYRKLAMKWHPDKVSRGGREREKMSA